MDITMVKCKILGCENRHTARGMCATHYSNWFQYHKPKGVGEVEYIEMRNRKALEKVRLIAQDLREQEGEVR